MPDIDANEHIDPEGIPYQAAAHAHSDANGSPADCDADCSTDVDVGPVDYSIITARDLDTWHPERDANFCGDNCDTDQHVCAAKPVTYELRGDTYVAASGSESDCDKCRSPYLHCDCDCHRDTYEHVVTGQPDLQRIAHELVERLKPFDQSRDTGPVIESSIPDVVLDIEQFADYIARYHVQYDRRRYAGYCACCAGDQHVFAHAFPTNRCTCADHLPD